MAGIYIVYEKTQVKSAYHRHGSMMLQCTQGARSNDRPNNNRAANEPGWQRPTQGELCIIFGSLKLLGARQSHVQDPGELKANAVSGIHLTNKNSDND